MVREELSVERRKVTEVSGGALQNLMVEYENFLDKNGNQVLDGTSFETDVGPWLLEDNHVISSKSNLPAQG